MMPNGIGRASAGATGGGGGACPGAVGRRRQKRRFYALFKKQGELVNESLEQLRNGLLEGQTRHPRLRELEHECDDVTHEIYNLINQTFVTPFEREDIYSLASSLDE